MRSLSLTPAQLQQAQAIALRRYNTASPRDRVARGLALLLVQQAIAGQSPAGEHLPLPPADPTATLVAGVAAASALQPGAGQRTGSPVNLPSVGLSAADGLLARAGGAQSRPLVATSIPE